MVFPLGDMEKTRIVPIVTYALIALNAALFLVQLDRGIEFTRDYAATPRLIVDGSLDGPAGAIPSWMTILSAMFLHGSPIHLAGNMLYLWIFGDNVEEVLGSWRYLLFYLGCGAAGTLLQVAVDPGSTVPTLGASGAIAGVMGAYLVWFPRNRVRVFVFRAIAEMPAALVIGLWIAMQVVGGYGSLGRGGGDGGVAYLAHLGGAGAGALAALANRNRARALLVAGLELPDDDLA